MNTADRQLLNALTTQFCDAIDALTDALREMRDELRARQEDPSPSHTPREFVLVPPPPPPLPGPSL